MKTIISVYMKESRLNKTKDKILKNKKIIYLISLITSIIILDQTIKFVIVKKIYNSSINIIKGMLNFTYIENTGGAYGIGNDSTFMFIIVNIIIITLIGKFILSKKNDISANILFSLGLIVAGGIGNLIDRVFRGFVIDYIDFNPLIKYPVFNLADICVVIGCLIVVINVIINIIKERRT